MKTEEKFFLGALIGSAIGAATALLFTPLDGKNLRKKIMDKIYQPLKTSIHTLNSFKRSRLTSKAHSHAKRNGATRKSPTKDLSKATSKTAPKTHRSDGLHKPLSKS